MRKIFLSLGIVLLLAGSAFAHGGGIDGYGGHNNRKAGNYHFHRGPLAGRTFSSKEEAIRALSDEERQSVKAPEKEQAQKQKADWGD